MRLRPVWTGLGVFALLAVVGLVIAALQVRAYLCGDEFRQLVEARTGGALRAETTLSPLQWTGSSVYAGTLEAAGEPGGALVRLEAQQVRAVFDWRAIFEGVWRVNRIDAVRLDAELGSPGETISQSAEVASMPPRRSWLPTRFELREVAVQDANLRFGESFAVRNSELVMKPEGEGWTFAGTGGRLDAMGRNDLTLEGFRARLQKNVFYLTDAAVRTQGAGRISASGEIGANDGYSIQVVWGGLAAAEWIDADWKDRLAGELSGSADVVGRRDAMPVVDGRFFLTEGRLEGLPIQARIADFTRSPQFRRMPLHEVSGNFRSDGATTDITDFVAESKGLLRVEGVGRVGADRSIEGTFRVGVTPQTLQWLPGSQERVFFESRDGYLWTEVVLGGTLDAPTEDLSVRLVRATGEQMIDTAVDVINQSPEKARDLLDEAIDMLSPLLR